MTVSFVVSRNNIKALAETREELSIGSGASAGVVIDDPIAAREHVVLRSAHGGLVAVPLETSTGTYLNGVPIDGESALGSTDVLVIGTTRIVVHLDSGQTPLGVRVDIEEKVATLFDQGDPDRWVHDEVSFGRFASTRTMVWLSALLGFGLLAAYAAIPPFRTHMVSPGPLAAAHAELSCDQCHTAFENSSHTTCLSSGCHADMNLRHPFAPESWTGHGGTLAAARIGTNGCTICHSMHAGEDIKPSYEEIERTSCYYCHERDIPDVGAEVKWRETFVTFDHQKHVSRGLGCADCHLPAEAGGEGDFAQVRYERCQECHSGVDGIPTLTTNWHGSDSGNCQWCHENTGSPELKTVDRPASRELANYTVKRRTHDFAAHAGLKDVEGRTCESCHRRGGETLLAGTTVDAPFEHALHVATLSDATACAKCHVAIAESETLANGARPSLDQCAACHHPPGAPNENLVLARVETTGNGAKTERRRDFPHAFHTTERALAHPLLADGCLTCHELGFDSSEEPGRAPATKPIANDCSHCHSDHALIGGGGCAGCHTPKSSGGLGHLAFTGVGVERVAVDFPHHIAGHQQASEYLKCDVCHTEIGSSTELGPGLTLPSWPGSCQLGGCHADETETRSFHFTGSR